MEANTEAVEFEGLGNSLEPVDQNSEPKRKKRRSPEAIFERADMWEDYCSGMELPEIAKKYNISKSVAAARLRDAVAELNDHMTEKMLIMRYKGLANLNRIQRKCWEIVDYAKGDSTSLPVVLKHLPVMEAMQEIRESEMAKAKLSGLLVERAQSQEIKQQDINVNIKVLDGNRFESGHSDVGDSASVHQ